MEDSRKSRKGEGESTRHQEEPLSSGAATHNSYSTASADENEKSHDTTNTLENEVATYSPPQTVQRYSTWRRRRENWVPVTTVVISLMALFVIVAQAIIYDQQRKVMEKQLQQSERGLRISERAYVGIASLDPNFDRKEVVIMIENIGRVPARDVKVEAHAYRRLADQLKLSGSTKHFDLSGIQLFPGSLKMSVIIPILNIRAENVEDIRTGRERFYVAGTIKYEDGFGNLDSNNFAFRYSPPPDERWTVDSDLAKQLGKPLEPNHP